MLFLIDEQVVDGQRMEQVKMDEDENTGSNQGNKILSHVDAMQRVNQVVAELITGDPLLYDLPQQVTLEEVNSCIALEHGQAMIVYVRRDDDTTMPIVVTQNATVLDLKHAIKRYVILKQQRNSGKTHLNWKYVWRTYWLHFQGQKLTDDRKSLKEYEIRNKDEVTFIKRLKTKIPS